MATPKATVLVFVMKGCGACTAFKPLLKRVASKFPQVPLQTLDIDKHSALAAKLGVNATPTTVMAHHKGDVRKIVGAVDEATLGKVFAAVARVL